MEPMERMPAVPAVAPSRDVLVFRCLVLLLLTGILLVQVQTMRASSRLITVGELRRINEEVRSKGLAHEVYFQAAERALAVEVQGTVDVTGEVSVEDSVAVTIDDTVTVDGQVICY